jgi:hypothetical protein
MYSAPFLIGIIGKYHANIIYILLEFCKKINIQLTETIRKLRHRHKDLVLFNTLMIHNRHSQDWNKKSVEESCRGLLLLNATLRSTKIIDETF